MEPSDSYLSKLDLLAAFRELDQRLSKDGITADLFIFGGAALVLGYEARPGTRDVDAIWRRMELSSSTRGILASSEAGQNRGSMIKRPLTFLQGLNP